MDCVFAAELGMSRTDEAARRFVARGVDVLSVPEFVRGFVGQAVTTPIEPHPGDLTSLCIVRSKRSLVQWLG